MAPWSILHHISFPSTSYFCRRLFCNLYFPTYTTKIPKIFMLSSLSDLTFVSDREGIDNPFIALVARFLFVCVGTRDFWGASYWIDNLVLKNWGKYLHYFAASPFPLQGKTNACSRGSSHLAHEAWFASIKWFIIKWFQKSIRMEFLHALYTNMT